MYRCHLKTKQKYPFTLHNNNNNNNISPVWPIHCSGKPQISIPVMNKN